VVTLRKEEKGKEKAIEIRNPFNPRLSITGRGVVRLLPL